MQVWQRPAQLGAQPRQRQPLAAQMRDRGRAGSQGAGAVKPACPATVVGQRADRAGAIQAWCGDTRRRAPDQGAEGMRRATWPRRLVPGAAQPS
jgi:hypothetical protein